MQPSENRNGGNAKSAHGDETEPGTGQTADGICPDCGGEGQVDGNTCPGCGGTGTVTVIVGDA